MRSIGYTTLELLLTPLQFGIPNSRLRYYFLAKKEPLRFQDAGNVSSDEVWRHIPGRGLAWSDPRLENQPSPSGPAVAHTILDYLDDKGEGYLEYAVPDKVLEKWGRLFDIVKPSSDRTCCFTRGILIYFLLQSVLVLSSSTPLFQVIPNLSRERVQFCREMKT
jgi:tRNA (cytosine38-C5)-methyltransferase